MQNRAQKHVSRSDKAWKILFQFKVQDKNPSYERQMSWPCNAENNGINPGNVPNKRLRNGEELQKTAKERPTYKADAVSKWSPRTQAWINGRHRTKSEDKGKNRQKIFVDLQTCVVCIRMGPRKCKESENKSSGCNGRTRKTVNIRFKWQEEVFFVWVWNLVSHAERKLEGIQNRN